jgi:hypothetical protein
MIRLWRYERRSGFLRREMRMRAVLVLGVVTGLVAASAAAGGGTTHGVRAPRIRGATNSTSSNWSGYAITGATFTDVKGSWVQPAVSCSGAAATTKHAGNSKNRPSKTQQSYAAFWVGLDGDVSNTVEQTGTDSDCNGSTPVYYAWYEFYPAYPVNLPNTVKPGDHMSAEVSVVGGTVTTSIADHSQNWAVSASQKNKNYALSSAEWIAEAPSGPQVLPLANFGTVTFTGASATGNGVAGPISAFTADQIVMATSSGQTKAVPGPLTTAGDSFTVTWNHS